MLKNALEDSRMFGLAHVAGFGSVREIGGIGIVRVCVKNSDGTSNLMLQGTARVRFTSWRDEPYPIAKIEPVTETGDGDSESLRGDILDQCKLLQQADHALPPQFDEYVSGIRPAGAFCDMVASIVITKPDARQRLLEELDIGERMMLLLSCLRAESGSI